GQLPKLPNGQQRVPQDTLVMPTEESRAATAVHA
ncbi:MAG: hypothetical protein QOI02_1896, partial [Actinomycetota bacterium]|nr:hypothetical protein [Actinomycetota bacterium]